ncbi:MAG: histidine kinase, partial [Cyanobacteria bacterium J06656_5]
HNGPLQTLANLLRRSRDEAIELPEICLGLEDLNREIRYIGDSIKQDVTDKKDSLDVSYAGTKFDLDIPLQELFQEVYDAMLSRPLLGFSNLKFTIISFEPIESEILNVEVKRKLCRFLEEALGNVGKHAVGATRLVVTGKNKDDRYELTVADNGSGADTHQVETGEGTRIGKEIEKLTRGKFVRRPNKPKGFFCQLIFPISA